MDRVEWRSRRLIHFTERVKNGPIHRFGLNAGKRYETVWALGLTDKALDCFQGESRFADPTGSDEREEATPLEECEELVQFSSAPRKRNAEIDRTRV